MSLTIKNLSYVYMPGTPLSKQALRDINLTVERGSFLAIAGRTGSGKSTLAQQMAGIITPTEGEVLIDGRPVKEARRQIGIVFQYPEQQLFEETVFADIAFGPKARKFPPQEIAVCVKEAMTLAGLDYEKFKDKSPFALSGGEKRRVAIAGVLSLRPKYLILDEPAAGLDPQGREDLLARIKRLHDKEKITIIMISHSMEDIARLADRVVFMEAGRILLTGPPHEAFLQTELLSAAGLRPPQTVLLMQQLKEAGFPVKINTFSADSVAEEILRVCGVKRC